MDNERVIRAVYEARAQRDWERVGSLFADGIAYHEPGEEDHSGTFRGRDEVVALLQKLVSVTEGTFRSWPGRKHRYEFGRYPVRKCRSGQGFEALDISKKDQPVAKVSREALRQPPE